MEAAFNNLQKQGKNDVESLIKWMKDSKLVEQTKEGEEKVRSFFQDVPDKANVSYEKFKEVVEKVATEFKKSLEGVTKQLAETGPKLMQSALGGATSALKDLLPKKK